MSRELSLSLKFVDAHLRVDPSEIGALGMMSPFHTTPLGGNSTTERCCRETQALGDRLENGGGRDGVAVECVCVGGGLKTPLNAVTDNT
ncbi:hypothetical protein Bpfe_026824 [Biomphalaria pfeifferi]|uniref:Uncharacterized protein n=1 Tax=Biomphalaria pfeifferi TaxID=112525 RepID=A0AAD8AWJ8_BIOPF|nr:hypothetical protein Bpfe_026824 [Biomphalaria pfeifferi]